MMRLSSETVGSLAPKPAGLSQLTMSGFVKDKPLTLLRLISANIKLSSARTTLRRVFAHTRESVSSPTAKMSSPKE